MSVELDIKEFRLARPGSEGYDKDDVDQFVVEVQAALLHRPPTMAPWEVRDKAFRTQRVHRGYDEHDVDDFLDRAERALREAHGAELSDPHEELSARRTHTALLALVVVLVVAAVILATVVTW